MRFFVFFMLLVLVGCDEPREAVQIPNNKQGIKSYKFNSMNNGQYGVDEIEIEGRTYFVLHNGSNAVSMMLKPEIRAEKVLDKP